MSEKALRKRIIQTLKPLHARPIENLCEKGTPDVNYIHGWIELKHLSDWPKLGGAVRLPHFTPHQKFWLQKHWKLGGAAHLLLQAGHDILTVRGCDVPLVGSLTKLQLIELSDLYLEKFDAKRILQHFRQAIRLP